MPEPTKAEIAQICIEHARRLIELKGERIGISEMRGLATHYVKGRKGSKGFKNKISQVNSFDEFEQC